MFGQNKIAERRQFDDGRLWVTEIFGPTIQGEGPQAGSPAIFLRLAGCLHKCLFCDTNFDDEELYDLNKISEKLLSMFTEHPTCKLLVITGGEPFLQNFIPIAIKCLDRGIAVSIETAGTVYLYGTDYFVERGGFIVCSPKTPKLNEQIIPFIGAYKYVVKAGEVSSEDGLPIFSTQEANKLSVLYRGTNAPVYVMPMTMFDPVQDSLNQKAAAAICMRYGYRFSPRLHMMLELP